MLRVTDMGIGRLQPALIIASAVAGIALSGLGEAPPWAVEAFLRGMLFVLFLTLDTGRVRDALGNRRFAAAVLSLNFILTPVLAWVLGLLFFDGSVDMRIGLLMLLVTPCTDWYLVFTRLGGGNVELGASILPAEPRAPGAADAPLSRTVRRSRCGDRHTVSPGRHGPDPPCALALAVAARIVLRGRGGYLTKMSERSDDIKLLLLCLAVAAMFSSEGESLLENPDLLVELFFPLLLFFLLLFFISRAFGSALGFVRRDTVSLTFTSMARNSPFALAIAAAAFPEMPLVSLALVIGPLIELPVLSAAAWATKRWVVGTTRA